MLLAIYTPGSTQMGWQRLPVVGEDWLAIGLAGRLMICKGCER